MDIKFKELNTIRKHDEDRSFLLRTFDDGVYELVARWSDYHNAYDCKVTEYIWDEEAQDYREYKNDIRLLTDADLADYLVEEEYEW